MRPLPLPRFFSALAFLPWGTAGKQEPRRVRTTRWFRAGTRQSESNIRSCPTGGNTLGLTLLELLTVLVLASLLGTLVMQGTGFFLGRYQTVGRVGNSSFVSS